MPQPSTPTAEDHMPVNFDHPELSDVTFVIHSKDGPHEFGAHRIAFTHVSDVFLSTLEDGKMLDDGSLRVDISDVDWNVFEAMIDFIYTAPWASCPALSVLLFRDKLEDILTVTTRFDLPGMKSLVEKHFIDYVEMNELTFKRACELYKVAVEHSAVAVQDFLLCQRWTITINVGTETAKRIPRSRLTRRECEKSSIVSAKASSPTLKKR